MTARSCLEGLGLNNDVNDLQLTRQADTVHSMTLLMRWRQK